MNSKLTRDNESVVSYTQRIHATDSYNSFQTGCAQSGRGSAASAAAVLSECLPLRGIARVLAPLALGVSLITTAASAKAQAPVTKPQPVMDVHLAADPDTAFIGLARVTAKKSASSSYRSIIDNAAKRYGLDPSLVHAVVRAESNYNPRTLSRVGAIGLMQLMPATARGLGVRNPWDPAQNVNGGARYLSWLMREFKGNVKLAVAAYNAGPGAVKRYGGIPPYRETKNYVNRVLAYRSQEAARRG